MTKKTTVNENEEFIVEVVDEGESDEALVVTSTKDFTQDLLKKAMSSYAGSEKTYSQQVDERAFMKTSLTEAKIEELAFLPQDNIEKVQQINSYIDLYLNKDDIIGRVYEIIEANTNADFQLSYPKVEGRNKEIKLKKVKDIIDEFNKQIELEELIIETIPYAYANGNRMLYLRKTKYGTYQVDRYPLGMVQYSSYKVNNEPVVVFSLPDLLGRMTGQTLISPFSTNSLTTFDLRMFPDMEDEIRENFSTEIYRAYLERKPTVTLNTDLTAVIRTNNRGKRYGVSPIFKALNPALKLEVQEKSDTMDSKARGKKIIFQRISDKLLGENGEDIDLSPSIYSHNEFVKAWKGEIVVYTGAPWVEDVKYVEPKQSSEHSNALNYYRSKVLSALGITFLNGDSKTGTATAQMSLNELMKEIDKIAKQLSNNINKWYKYILNEAGLPIEYAPTIEVLDSEIMNLSIRMQLADSLFNKYGASYRSTYELMGMDYESEKEKRESENEENLDKEVFYARQTAFTFSAKGEEDYVYEGNDGTDNKDKQSKTPQQQTNDEIRKEGETDV